MGGEGGAGGQTVVTGSGGATGGGNGGAGPSTGSGGQGGATATGGSGGATGRGGAGGTGGATATGGSGGATGVGGAGGVGGATGAGGAGGTMKAVAGLPEYWVGPAGLDSNPGTQALPFQTIGTAEVYAGPGSTIWLLPGTYQFVAVVKLTKNGTAASPMNIFAAPGARPVIDFSLQPRDNGNFRGFEISGDYWHLKGFEVKNAGDNCVLISGSHNTIEQLSIHSCDDTGLQITVDSAQAGDATRGAFNTILNSDSFDNFDSATGGENADGFDAKLYIGPGNVFQGCRAWNNSDDGWDLFAANDVVTITGCWSMLNGKTVGGVSNPQGDGNGFKLGGAPAAGDPNQGGAVHVVTSSFAFENLACGFTQNSNPNVPRLNMCGSARNKTAYCQTLTQTAANNGFTMTAAQAIAVQRNADGSLPAIH